MRYSYKTNGTCSRQIDFEVENGIVTEVSFMGGCNGNLKGISSLVNGMKVEDVIDRLSGIRCGFKNTSCPDQFAKALSQIKGLGPKTAQRIIVDLKDKILKIDLGDDAPGELILDVQTPSNNETHTEAVSALTMLGFAAAASGKVVDKILKDNPNIHVEQVIKLALKML